MALNFEGPIAFDADAVPVNYFDQDLDEEDVFFQPSPKATGTITHGQEQKEADTDASFSAEKHALPQVEEHNELILLHDASLFSPIPPSTREALDLASPLPSFHFPDTNDTEFSDLGHASDKVSLETRLSAIDHSGLNEVIREDQTSTSSPFPISFVPEIADSTSHGHIALSRSSFIPCAPHPAACFAAGGQLMVFFRHNQSRTTSIKHLLRGKSGLNQSLASLSGPLLASAQDVGQILESARLTPPASSLATERLVARDLLAHTMSALYRANEKPFEPTVAQYLMESLASTSAQSSASPHKSSSSLSSCRNDSESREMSDLFGEIDAVFTGDKLLELERSLLTGDLTATQQLALKLHFSSHALVLSLLPQPPSVSYSAIIHFALSLPAGPLRSLYLRIARYQGQIFGGFRWREDLLLALCFPGERSALLQLAFHLEEMNPEAANLCFLIIGQPPLAQLTTTRNENTLQQHQRRILLCSRRQANLEALRFCEMFEFIHYHHLHVSVPEFHIDLQLLKFVIVGMLIDYGYREKALAYLTSILQQGELCSHFAESLQWTSHQLHCILSPSPRPPSSLLSPSPRPPSSQLSALHQVTHDAERLSPAAVPASAINNQNFPFESLQYQQSNQSLYNNISSGSQTSEAAELTQQQLSHSDQSFIAQPYLNPQHVEETAFAPQPTQSSRFNSSGALFGFAPPPREFQSEFVHDRYSPVPSSKDSAHQILESSSASVPSSGHSESASKKNSGGGWFSGIKKLLAVPEAREANLEQDHSFYYDEKLGRYVGTWREEDQVVAPKPHEVPLPLPPIKSLVRPSAATPAVRYALDASALSFIQ